MAKKNRKRKIYNYDKHAQEFGGYLYPMDDERYYGIHREKGRVGIDIKRMKKVCTSFIPEEVLNKASAIPRNTVYFYPAKYYKMGYTCNVFRALIADLKNKWCENKKAFQTILTPSQAQENARIGLLADGILDFDEAGLEAAYYGIKRMQPYYELKISFNAQFIHDMASELLAKMLYQAKQLGYDYEDVTRNKLETYLEGTIKKRTTFEELPHFRAYNIFLGVWNFLKHNSVELFEKVKARSPELLLTDTYKNGQLAKYILKIDDEYIEKTLDELQKFYDEFSEAFFGDNLDFADWNYSEYFIQSVEEEIESIRNPLGLNLV